jgi:hypothetical protein
MGDEHLDGAVRVVPVEVLDPGRQPRTHDRRGGGGASRQSDGDKADGLLQLSVIERRVERGGPPLWCRVATAGLGSCRSSAVASGGSPRAVAMVRSQQSWSAVRAQPARFADLAGSGCGCHRDDPFGRVGGNQLCGEGREDAEFDQRPAGRVGVGRRLLFFLNRKLVLVVVSGLTVSGGSGHGVGSGGCGCAGRVRIGRTRRLVRPRRLRRRRAGRVAGRWWGCG